MSKDLILSDQAKADLAAIERGTRVRIASALKRFAETSTGNVKKLQGINPPEYRLRVGDWQVRFHQDKDSIFVNGY